MGIYIHPTAIVEDGVEIGDGSRVWHFVHIREGAKIGKDCNIGQGVYIDFDVKIGDNVKIQNYCSIYHGLTIEDNVFIGPHVVTTNDKNPRAVNPDGSPVTDDDWVCEKTLIKKGTAIGARSVLLPGITVGENVVIGAGTTVTKDVPPNVTIYQKVEHVIIPRTGL